MTGPRGRGAVDAAGVQARVAHRIRRAARRRHLGPDTPSRRSVSRPRHPDRSGDARAHAGDHKGAGGSTPCRRADRAGRLEKRRRLPSVHRRVHEQGIARPSVGALATAGAPGGTAACRWRASQGQWRRWSKIDGGCEMPMGGGAAGEGQLDHHAQDPHDAMGQIIGKAGRKVAEAVGAISASRSTKIHPQTRGSPWRVAEVTGTPRRLVCALHARLHRRGRGTGALCRGWV